MSKGKPFKPERECKYLSPKEAAQDFGVTERTVVRWIKEGRFPGTRQIAGKYGRILIPEGMVRE